MAIEASWRLGCRPPTLRVGGQGAATKATDTSITLTAAIWQPIDGDNNI